MALPVLVLGGVLNVLGIQQIQPFSTLSRLPMLISAGLLLLLFAAFLLFVDRYYTRIPRLVLWCYFLVAVPADYGLAGLCQYWLDVSRDPQDFEYLINDAGFFLILPVLFLALILLGWLFDHVKNQISQG